MVVVVVAVVSVGRFGVFPEIVGRKKWAKTVEDVDSAACSG